MKRNQKRIKRKQVFVAAIACMILVGSTAAYAADVGGIQRTVQLWVHGDQTEATIYFDGNGNYTANYDDPSGNATHKSGGGVAINPNGSERPLSEDELMEELTAPEVQYLEDGSVWVYWFDQKLDITDKFENEVCYVKLVHDEETLYMTVKFQKGLATSPHRYLRPWEFNGA